MCSRFYRVLDLIEQKIESSQKFNPGAISEFRDSPGGNGRGVG